MDKGDGRGNIKIFRRIFLCHSAKVFVRNPLEPCHFFLNKNSWQFCLKIKEK